MDKLFCFSMLFSIVVIFSHASSDPVEDKQALLDFLLKTPHTRTLNWNQSSSACKKWTGVTCSAHDSRITALRLPGFGFYGFIPQNTISRLSAIHILSLRLNNFSGPFPFELSNLGNLTALYLQDNKFSGPIPSNLSVWKNLAILDLSNNIFSGEIPNLNLPSLQLLNLSNNNLSGEVPPFMHKFPIAAYNGNNNLFIKTPNRSGHIPLPKTPKKSKKLTEAAILGIVLSGFILGFMVIALFSIFCCSDRRGRTVSWQQKDESSSSKWVSQVQDGSNSRLVYFEGRNLAFDLEDLLRASAEVLGKGSCGMSYKAALGDSTTTVVVKRLKDVNVTKKEFEAQMQIAGNVRHENVAPLRAYYYAKEEKLLMYDYYSQGSVSSMLHGNRNGPHPRTPLDWETRLRIIIGAARGVAHLHAQGSGKFVIGNIKSSNVFLNSHRYGCISDFGLSALSSSSSMIHSTAPARPSGYRAPELVEPRRPSQSSDVYSFGVLILELLTGKYPENPASGNGNGLVDLVRWVHSVVREEWTAEVFDLELLRIGGIEEELVDMLRIGVGCVVGVAERRPKMGEVVVMVEEFRQDDD